MSVLNFKTDVIIYISDNNIFINIYSDNQWYFYKYILAIMSVLNFKTDVIIYISDNTVTNIFINIY